VLGSVLAIIAAQQIGYRATLLAAAGLYLAAGLAIAPAARADLERAKVAADRAKDLLDLEAIRPAAALAR
jgi:hypothetical protein